MMRRLSFMLVVLVVQLPSEVFAQDGGRAANTIILDENGVKNLRIETEPVEPRDFESTLFAIGRIAETPSSRSVLSSRISGRAAKVHAFVGDHVEEGATLVEVESRQLGDPPQIVPLQAAQSGLIIESHVNVGQPIEPEAELLDISDRSVMWAVAKIPENEAALVSPGTAARIRVPALGGEVIEAKLFRFGVVADLQAGTVEGIFELPNPEGRLQPGMRAEFSMITAQRKDVMAVPRIAIQGDPSKRMVFVKDYDLKNAFVRAPVQLGEQNDGYVEILNGLFPGDEVVTQGAYALGFAGGGSISLKEALDAAHGHEHNEDGSEITEEQKAAAAAEDAMVAGNGDGRLSIYLQIYAVVITLLLIVMTQLVWKNHRASV